MKYSLYLFGVVLIFHSNTYATICTLAGTYNANSFQTAVNSCGTNDSIYLTGSVSYVGGGSVTLQSGQTLFVYGSITQGGSSTLVSSNIIYVVGSGTYSLSSTAAAVIVNGTSYPGAFTVNAPGTIPIGGSPLPVTLSKFSGFHIDNTIQLSWVTESEINNRGFSIEKSENGRDFREIGYISGNGNSNKQIEYQFIDNSIESKINYYRLIQYDYNDRFEVFKIIAVNTPDISFNAEIFPNPVTNNILKIKSTEEAEYQIYNDIGIPVFSGIIGALENQILLSDIAMGKYFIEFRHKKGSYLLSFYKF